MAKALYRKWRPQVFDDVYGQDHITTTLKNEVKSNKFSHAYLFTGSRGTGKTTCSKILAKAVNCLNPQNGNPCLECANCKQIEFEQTLDVLEIDAASNNGVDNIRQLREEALYTPSVCKYRVYIIDETHMLSQGAFNALLKIMEEPPAHVIFILATTEVHKVPATILSRCQRFDFKRIEPQTIAEKLKVIAKSENFVIDEDAALTIAKISDGGMRDAISLTDQCWSISDDITLKLVKEVAAIAGREYIYSLTDFIAKKDVTSAIKIIGELYKDSKNLEQLCSELIEFFRNIMLFKVAGTLDGISNVMPDEATNAEKFSSCFKINKVLQIINQLQDCKIRQSKVSNKRLELEMCFIKLCDDTLDFSADGLTSRLENLENLIKSGNISINNSNQITKQNSQTQNNKEKQTESQIIQQPENQEKTNDEFVDDEEYGSPPPEDFESQNNYSEDNHKMKISDGEFEQWQDVILNLKKINMALYGIIMNTTATLENGAIIIKSEGNMILEKMLMQDMQRKSLEKAIMQTVGTNQPFRLENSKIVSKKAPVLERFINHAKQAGVEVEQEP